MLSRVATAPSTVSHGLSIVELMIGITIGLFILAGVSLVVTEQISSNRRLMLEIQIQQDLRAAADIISRDIRRAGYYGNMYQAVWPTSAASASIAASNPYAAVTPSSAPASAPTESVKYSYSTDLTRTAGVVIDDDVLTDAKEASGFRLNSAKGSLEMYINGWQELTDPNIVRIIDFQVVLDSTPIVVPCAKVCLVVSATCPPRQYMRNATIRIVGQAVHDSRVERSIRSDVRLRNDIASGACPA